MIVTIKSSISRQYQQIHIIVKYVHQMTAIALGGGGGLSVLVP